MFKLLEKWVNERGSANIMEKRLGLKDDEMAAIDRELTSLMSEHSQLKSENKDLNVSLNAANKEIGRLEKIIDSTAVSQRESELDDVKKNILKALFEANSHATVSHLSAHFGIKESLVQYHIDDLKDKKLINFGPIRINSPIPYEISRAGRKHVVEVIGI